MRKNTFKRLMSLLLSASMMLLCYVPVLAAEDTDVETDSTETETEGAFAELSENLLKQVSYDEYLAEYEGMPAGEGEVIIKGVDYDEEKTTANVTIESGVYGKDEEVALIPESGSVTWTFDVEKAGMYSIEFEYAAANDKKTNIERVFYINDKVPCVQARSVDFLKTWKFAYTEQEDGTLRFALDANGNEARPDSYCEFVWTESVFYDSNTYFQDPFTFYFKEGTNTITLQGSRDSLYLAKIKLFVAEEIPSYEDVLKEYDANGYTNGNATIYIDGELPDSVSGYTIYPDYDRSSAISAPQDPILIKRNVVGGDNWQTPGEWVRYNFTVPEGGAGLYNILLRFKQDISDGVFTSRTVKIDGELPFEEAYGCQFPYSTEWQVTALCDGQYQFSFYLEEGDHVIELMAALGDFGPVLTDVKEIAEILNEYYLQIMKLTGAAPDANRDYGFSRIMPDVVKGFSAQADALESIIATIETATTSNATSSNAILESMVTVLREMASDESEIAPNITAFRDAVSSMSAWIADYEIQPLLVDYIQIQSPDAELPQVNATAWESLKYEFAQFVGSFYADYNTLATESEEGEVEYSKNIEVWTSEGRDQAQIMRNLIDSGFCEESGIGVSLKIVDGSALLPSILAGVGPDLSFGASSPIDYALRGACYSFNKFEDFEEVVERFVPATLIPLTLFGETYAIPASIGFSMMFIRTDIFEDLGLEIPKTWDDILSIVPILQYNNMDAGIPNGYTIFLYQRGGNMWDETSENVYEHGWRTTLDDNFTLEAFEDMCEIFTQYSLPIAFDANTRFKDGGMPILISDSSFYTSITISAPEIAGLWEMYPLPGTVDEEGNINNTGILGTAGYMLIKGCSDEQATWEFIKWATDVDYQVDYTNEMIALLGPSAKSVTPNIEAMKQMPWDTDELEALLSQMEHLTAIPSYPGDYIISRYVDFAFNNAYNEGADPVTELLSHVNAIHTEISRKRKEFDLPIYGEEPTTSEE